MLYQEATSIAENFSSAGTVRQMFTFTILGFHSAFDLVCFIFANITAGYVIISRILVRLPRVEHKTNKNEITEIPTFTFLMSQMLKRGNNLNVFLVSFVNFCTNLRLVFTTFY